MQTLKNASWTTWGSTDAVSRFTSKNEVADPSSEKWLETLKNAPSTSSPPTDADTSPTRRRHVAEEMA
jgi:mannose-6-phosphate isomerase class I